MESLLGKRCFLKRSFAISEEDFPINLTGTIGNVIFNQIKIVEDPWEAGNELVDLCFCNGDYIIESAGEIYNGIFSRHYGAVMFTITGGEGVNDPNTIEKIVNMCEYIMCEPSNSPESLDNKVIEFNWKITGFPNPSSSKLNGIFKYRFNNWDYVTYANTVEFDHISGQIRFIGLADSLIYDLRDRKWYTHYNSGNSYVEVSDVIFEDFKYTGLENDEGFMRWLSNNAKITPKKHKDRKITNLKGCTLVFEKGSFYTIAPAINLYGYAFDGKFNDNPYHQLGSLDDLWNFQFFSMQRIPSEDMDPDYIHSYGPSIPGDYYCIITLNNSSYAHLEYENGYYPTLDLPIRITDVDAYSFNENPDFIEYLINCGVKIIPQTFQFTYCKFKPVLTAFPPINYNSYGWRIRAVVSYNLSGRPVTHPVDYLMLEPLAFAGETDSVERLAFYHPDGDEELKKLGYSFTDQRWYYYGSDEVPEDVTFKYFTVFDDRDIRIPLSEWIVDNTDVFYMAKGINTIEEFLTEICDIIRVSKRVGNENKIKAQDILPELFTTL